MRVALRFSLHGLFLGGLFLGLVSCGAPDLSQAQLDGVWVTADGSRMAIHGNEIAIVDVPLPLLLVDDEPDVRVNANGRISIGQKKGLAAWRDITVDLRPFGKFPQGMETQVYFDVEDNQPELFFWKGEEGGPRVVFRRQPVTRSPAGHL